MSNYPAWLEELGPDNIAQQPFEVRQKLIQMVKDAWDYMFWQSSDNPIAPFSYRDFLKKYSDRDWLDGEEFNELAVNVWKCPSAADESMDKLKQAIRKNYKPDGN